MEPFASRKIINGVCLKIPVVIAESNLSAAAVYLFSYICSCWEKGVRAYVFGKKLRKLTRLKKESIVRANNELVRLGLISLEKRGHTTVATPNEENANKYFGYKLLSIRQTNDKEKHYGD